MGRTNNLLHLTLRNLLVDMHWFTSDKSAIEAGEVGAQGKGIIMETYLNIEKPAGWAEYDKFTIDELLGRGYDGLIYLRAMEQPLM